MYHNPITVQQNKILSFFGAFFKAAVTRPTAEDKLSAYTEEVYKGLLSRQRRATVLQQSMNLRIGVSRKLATFLKILSVSRSIFLQYYMGAEAVDR